MLQNYIKTALRYLLRFKLHTLINIGGFTAGLAISMFIVLWIVDELRVDKFHGNNVYRVLNNYTYSDGSVNTGHFTQSPLAEIITEDIPEVEKAIRVSRKYEGIIQYETASFKEFGHYADPDFFRVFTFAIVHGNPEHPLPNIHSIAISSSLAKKIFNDENAIGKSIQFDRANSFTVSAIFQDPPVNSSMQFDYIVPFESFLKDSPWLTGWNNNSIFTYIKLKEGSSPQSINEKLAAIFKKHCTSCENSSFIFPFSKLHLYGKFENGVSAGGRIELVRLFSISAIVILIMSCVNFTILVTAQATTRMKEIGIRKVAGATRKNLIRQFFGESILLSLVSFLMAISIVLLTLPMFNSLTDQQIRFDGDLNIWLIFVAIAICTGLIAGAYPSLYLSALKPANIMKGTNIPGSHLGGLPKGLVIAQLTLSSILIVGSIIIYEQLSFIQTKDLGFKKDDIIVMMLNDSIAKNPDTFKESVMTISSVKSVGLANHQPFSVTRFWNTVSWPGKPDNTKASFYVISSDAGFIPTFEMQLLEGRNFDVNGSDKENFLINESAAHAMGLKNPVGTVLHTPAEGKIIGVVKDFHNDNLHSDINPLLITYSSVNRYVFIKITPGQLQPTLTQLQSLSKEIDPGYPFEYQILKENFEAEYKSESITKNLSVLFACISTFISSIGLFGMVMFIADRKSKEISIRKIMGASIRKIVILLTRQFTTLVVTAFFISLPLGYYIMSGWLLKFTYRIEMSWKPFAIAGMLSVLIALLTISYQTIRAALVNPLDSLHNKS